MISKFAIATIFFAFFGFSVAAEQSIAALLKPVENLTSQDTRPFLYNGNPMTPESGRWKQYRNPLGRFPTTLSCLEQSEQGKSVVDLMRIDWTAPEYVQGLDVCIFRILASLDSLEEIEAWLAYHEFRIIPHTRVVSDQPQSTNPRPYYRTHKIEGYWTPDAYHQRRPKTRTNWFKRLTGVYEVRSFSLTIWLTNDARITSVRMYYSTG
jgi:hypothetical protein